MPALGILVATLIGTIIGTTICTILDDIMLLRVGLSIWVATHTVPVLSTLASASLLRGTNIDGPLPAIVAPGISGGTAMGTIITGCPETPILLNDDCCIIIGWLPEAIVNMFWSNATGLTRGSTTMLCPLNMLFTAVWSIDIGHGPAPDSIRPVTPWLATNGTVTGTITTAKLPQARILLAMVQSIDVGTSTETFGTHGTVLIRFRLTSTGTISGIVVVPAEMAAGSGGHAHGGAVGPAPDGGATGGCTGGGVTL